VGPGTTTLATLDGARMDFPDYRTNKFLPLLIQHSAQHSQCGVESIDERGVGGLETGRVAGRARFGLTRCRRPGAAEQQNGRLASEAPVLSLKNGLMARLGGAMEPIYACRLPRVPIVEPPWLSGLTDRILELTSTQARWPTGSTGKICAPTASRRASRSR
jgi:hypothetical protein